MWRYTNIRPIKITIQMVHTLLSEHYSHPPPITQESIPYLDELYKPYLEKLNCIKPNTVSNQLVDILPIAEEDKDDVCTREQALNALLKLLFWHNKSKIADDYIIDPWVIRGYINKHNNLRQVFNLPEFTDSYQITIPITRTVRTHSGKTKDKIIDLSYWTLLGIMAMYRYLNKMHPLSYAGYQFEYEMETVNDMAFYDTKRENGWYTVRIGNDVDKVYTYYSYQSLNFYVGLLAAGDWNNFPYENVIKIM